MGPDGVSGASANENEFHMNEGGVVKRTTLGMIAMIAALGVAGQAEAQMGTLPISAEVRGGFGFPMGDFGDDAGRRASAGPGFEANVGLGLTQMVGVYAGFNWFEFGQESSVIDDENLTDSGLNAGAMLNLSGMAPMGPWIRGGVVWHKLEGDRAFAGVADRESDRSLGFEVGGGLSFPLGMVISVTPGVRYVSYTPQYDGNAADNSNVSYLIADVGLRFGF